MKPDQQRGLYGKYLIHNADGTLVPDEAEYFVLRLDKGDPHALNALRAYAISCADAYPQLAQDLREKIDAHDKEYLSCPECGSQVPNPTHLGASACSHCGAAIRKKLSNLLIQRCVATPEDNE
jgi:DNA-directed RNA polymerase subunit RPC12/RpoP